MGRVVHAENRERNKKGGRVECCCGLGKRERDVDMHRCAESLTLELLAQEKSVKRKEEAHMYFLCVFVSGSLFWSLFRCPVVVALTAGVSSKCFPADGG